MAKPINENIREVRIENEDGDLIPLLDHAGQKFSELVNAVMANNKAGSLTLKIHVKPSTAGALAVRSEVSTVKPNTLAVRFNTGALYHYTGVDAAKFNEFHKAPSIGSHFGKHIKGVHDYKRIPEEKKGDK